MYEKKDHILQTKNRPFCYIIVCTLFSIPDLFKSGPSLTMNRAMNSMSNQSIVLFKMARDLYEN